MIQRSKYRKLRKAVKKCLDEQAGHAFVAITKGPFTMMFREISSREIDEAWPHIVRDFGLVDDGTGYDTWTIPGRGIRNAYKDVPTKQQVKSKG